MYIERGAGATILLGDSFCSSCRYCNCHVIGGGADFSGEYPKLLLLVRGWESPFYFLATVISPLFLTENYQGILVVIREEATDVGCTACSWGIMRLGSALAGDNSLAGLSSSFLE